MTLPEQIELFVSVLAQAIEFSLGPVGLVVSIGFVGLIVSAPVLWLSAKWLRFRNPSFWTSLRCMALAIGVSLVGVVAMPRLPFWATIGVGFGSLAIAGVISIAWLFGEAAWKTVAAIGLVFLSEALCLVVCYAALVILIFRSIEPW